MHIPEQCKVASCSLPITLDYIAPDYGVESFSDAFVVESCPNGGVELHLVDDHDGSTNMTELNPAQTNELITRLIQARGASSMFDLVTVLESKTSLLTVPEVAEVFRMSERTVKKHVSNRKIPSFLIGGKRLFDPAQLLRWAVKKNPKIMDGRPSA